MRTTSRSWRVSCKVRLLQPGSSSTHTRLICVSPPRLCPSGYNDTEQEKNSDCEEGQYFVQDNTEESTKVVCRFKRDLLSLCSGLSDTNFGYSEGQPCVLLKMNRVRPNSRSVLQGLQNVH